MFLKDSIANEKKFFITR